MRALVYEGPRKVVVKEMPDAQIQDPTDVLVRITNTNICGSDLHMYEGRTDPEHGRIIGHENLGEIIECGSAVSPIHAGRAEPSFVVSHRLSLDEAPEAYQHFDAREHGWTKVILEPQMGATLPH